jgi:hypothetical protein
MHLSNNDHIPLAVDAIGKSSSDFESRRKSVHCLNIVFFSMILLTGYNCILLVLSKSKSSFSFSCEYNVASIDVSSSRFA